MSDLPEDPFLDPRWRDVPFAGPIRAPRVRLCGSLQSCAAGASLRILSAEAGVDRRVHGLLRSFKLPSGLVDTFTEVQASTVGSMACANFAYSPYSAMFMRSSVWPPTNVGIPVVPLM
jgi:hypothetical protein